jgi:hypothetical protein
MTQSTRRALPRQRVDRMWHDAWPPTPPGGHRPPDAPPVHQPRRPAPGPRPRRHRRRRRAGVGHRTGRRPGLRAHLAGAVPGRRRPRPLAPAAPLERPRPGLARPSPRTAARPGGHVRLFRSSCSTSRAVTLLAVACGRSRERAASAPAWLCSCSSTANASSRWVDPSGQQVAVGPRVMRWTRSEPLARHLAKTALPFRAAAVSGRHYERC